MNNHTKKKIAPIVVNVILLVYYGLYFGMIITTLPLIWKIVCGIVPVVLGIATICVCVQRIKEIDKGEEDDISKY